MTWSLRITDHASHMVYSQQAVNSCGIASVIMINFNMKKWLLAVAGAILPAPTLAVPSFGLALHATVKSEKEVDLAYSKVTGKSYDGTTYTDAKMLVKVLNELGIGNWVCEWYPTSQVAHKITQFVGTRNGAPVITHMAWNNGGYHFIVCDTIVRTRGKVYGDFCDPGDGTARTFPLVQGQNVNYDKNGSIAGALTGWVVYRTRA
ncbi:MAG: hypothetical protein KBF66_15835 [Rhodoferax sp.]|uniref:hypothetical protein n=1 Tax=Rhodoferax sp. TaxID=50421 RepID=UPI001B4A4799|nr:hypothetical protein [Rhodoferax sp.]MBP9907021.1 hypothetical protein [Rhodoferax sp.]